MKLTDAGIQLCCLSFVIFLFFGFGLCCVIIIIINCFHSIRAILLFDMKHNDFTHTKISSRKCFVRVFIHISLQLFLSFYLFALLVIFFLCFFPSSIKNIQSDFMVLFSFQQEVIRCTRNAE